jgi:hypothetical protein
MNEETLEQALVKLGEIIGIDKADTANINESYRLILTVLENLARTAEPAPILAGIREPNPAGWITDRDEFFFDRTEAFLCCDGFITPVYY